MAKLIPTNLCDALRAAALPDDKARAAAAAVADCDRRIERIETKLPSCSFPARLMVAVMLGGFDAICAQPSAMSAKLEA